MSNIFKIWGERRRILLDDNNEIDLLYLKKDSFCSTHKHQRKINNFILISGKVMIETEFGKRTLYPGDSFGVNNKTLHRFVVLENSVMIEIAFVMDGYINPDDIERRKQGGRIIDGKEYTENELRERGMLEL